MQCFHVTVNRVRTRFPKETEVTNRETVGIADPGKVENLFLMVTGIICLIKQGMKRTLNLDENKFDNKKI